MKTKELFTILDENYVDEVEAAAILGYAHSTFNHLVLDNRHGLKGIQTPPSKHIKRKLWLKDDIVSLKKQLGR